MIKKTHYIFKESQSVTLQNEESSGKQSPPNVTAQSWIIVQNNKKVFRSFKPHKTKEIASLTKIMTCLCTISIIQIFNLNPDTLHCFVTENAANVPGTSAQLRLGDWLTLKDLLFGMMLPSGNDAAQCISQCLGALVYFNDLNQLRQLSGLKKIDLREQGRHLRLYTSIFVDIMNKKAYNLRLKQTKFDNVHGLPNKNNYSTNLDLAKITIAALNKPLFRQIIASKSYTCDIYRLLDKEAQLRTKIEWTNTNRLLWESNWIGVKTGITDSAKACLCSVYKRVVLGSRDVQSRFTDSVTLLQEWRQFRERK